MIDMTIIMTREAKEATVMMTSKKEIAIMLAIKASHTMWTKGIVTLVPNPRVAVAAALQVTATFQAADALVLALIQMKISVVKIITMWRNSTWTLMRERYLQPVTLIRPSNIEYWRWQGQNPRPKRRK
eukprot:2954547-Ditylum_brightwellii.AAC.1